MIKDLEATGIGITIGITVFLLVNVAMGRPLLPGAEREHEPIVVPEIDLNPESLYAKNCAACHQANGEGLAGTFPPLAGSEWVIEDPETPVRVLLLGIGGPIDVAGESYDGVMPTQGHLNEEQIALVATYIRTNWGNEGSEVTTEEVEAVKAELAARLSTPCSGGEELTTLRGAE